MPYTSETVYQIWDDNTGERLEVSPDRDGLDLVEVRYVTDDGQTGNSITMTREQAVLVAEAIRKVAADIKAQEELQEKK